MIKKLLYGIIIITFLPLILFLVWFLTPETKLIAVIVDKSTLTNAGQEHISLNWVLNHERFTNNKDQSYQVSSDYYGFFPLDDEKFNISGLEQFSSDKLKELSKNSDLFYITDTYGIYYNDWYRQKDKMKQSKMLYGGLSANDVQMAGLMKEQKKLIIAEFNTIGSPTAEEERKKFEEIFHFKWTGWTVKHFESLDTTANGDLPHWLINNYKKQNNNQWPFKKAGVIFVHSDESLVILEDSTHLSNPMPQILSNQEGRTKLELPENVKYPFWFDIITFDENVNKSAADFKISTNQKGLSELKKHGIPATFPAITYHDEDDYQFYYFSGDFCDNPISLNTSYFKGIGNFKWLFYDSRNPMERASFFWNFYRPMMTNILIKYTQNRISAKRSH
ncbi:hypothetical protein [Daejeonella sp. H1SJ63]|uniref:hypothetical protein n=1 Tax=Daejeonella sp. H1SJ63 TaxID=3034145 RepID=UPI0023EA8713|nr:hypothetical protein [Daejeonella sp. H1SJ63]